MPIIISRQGHPARKLDPTPFTAESDLQAFIAQNPECLLVDEMANTTLLILGREFPTASGPIDVLAVDAEGMLYVIETKLFKNPDKRRVLAQVLDYGAAIWTAASAAPIGASLDAFALGQGQAALPDRLRAILGLTDEAVDEVIAQVNTNASQGKFRFVVLMDTLDDRLKDLVRFLNENSNFEVLAVEMDVYQHDDMKIVIPRLFGAQTRKHAAQRSADSWTAESTREDLAQRPFAPAHRQLLDWLLDFGDRLARSGAASLSYGAGARPSVIIATPRSTVMRIAVGKDPSEVSVSFEMVHWRGDRTPIDLGLTLLSETLSDNIEFQPGRKLPIAHALLGKSDKSAEIERRLRELIAAL